MTINEDKILDKNESTTTQESLVVEESLKNDSAVKTEADLMVDAGVHLGHRVNKKNPKMDKYIFGVRNGVSVIDVSKTEEELEKALMYIEKLISEKGTLMVVGTKVQLRKITKSFAEESDIPYVIERWLGGTFTNFEIIKKRVDYLKELETKKESGDLEKYTKKERLDIDRKIESLKIKFEGLKKLEKNPDAVLILDMEKDEIAVKEAIEKNVKIIGITDTNIDPNLADYPIPANDDAVSSISYVLDRIKKSILKVKKIEESK